MSELASGPPGAHPSPPRFFLGAWRGSEEKPSTFVEWCQSAPCAQGAVAERCAQAEPQLLTGENPDAPPRPPLPPSFCEAVVTLSGSGCPCDPAYAEVPGTDETLSFVGGSQAQAPGAPGTC